MNLDGKDWLDLDVSDIANIAPEHANDVAEYAGRFAYICNDALSKYRHSGNGGHMASCMTAMIWALAAFIAQSDRGYVNKEPGHHIAPETKELLMHFLTLVENLAQRNAPKPQPKGER